MSNEILEVLQQIVMNTVKTMKPCNVVFGTVDQVSPIKIALEGVQVLDEDFVVKTRKGVFRLEEGDKVALVRLEGGQEYLLLDKVVDG